MNDARLRELLKRCLVRLQQIEPYSDLTRRVGVVVNEPRMVAVQLPPGGADWTRCGGGCVAGLRTGGVVPPTDAKAEIETVNMMRREVVDAISRGSEWVQRPLPPGRIAPPPGQDFPPAPIRVVTGKEAA